MVNMSIKKKIFEYVLNMIGHTCGKYYAPIEYSPKDGKDISKERKCNGCPFEYETETGTFGCHIMKTFRERSKYNPIVWEDKFGKE